MPTTATNNSLRGCTSEEFGSRSFGGGGGLIKRALNDLKSVDRSGGKGFGMGRGAT